MNNKSEITILLVEDDEGHAKLIETNLRRGGISNGILFFNNGKRVVDFLFNDEQKNVQINSDHFLMLLDLNMPVMDGMQVLKKVKSDNRTKQIPIIILTTTEDKREVQKCYELGCNVYISKPVEYSRFAKAITELGLFLTVVKVPDIKKNVA